jgi:hypothetical protein
LKVLRKLQEGNWREFVSENINGIE